MVIKMMPVRDLVKLVKMYGIDTVVSEDTVSTLFKNLGDDYSKDDDGVGYDLSVSNARRKDILSRD